MNRFGNDAGRLELVHRSADVRQDPALERRGCTARTTRRTTCRSPSTSWVIGVARAGVADDLPVARLGATGGVPSLGLSMPHVLAAGDPVRRVRLVRLERRDEPRGRIARARRVGEREAGRRDLAERGSRRAVGDGRRSSSAPCRDRRTRSQRGRRSCGRRVLSPPSPPNGETIELAPGSSRDTPLSCRPPQIASPPPPGAGPASA